MAEIRIQDGEASRRSEPDPEPPLVVTLVRGKRHKAHRQLTEWELPPGEKKVLVTSQRGAIAKHPD